MEPHQKDRRPLGVPCERISDVRVLVVEDEQLLADAVATGLRREAMAVDVVYDGAAALERVGVNDYDVIVLDRDLPWSTGTTSAARWSSSRCPPGS